MSLRHVVVPALLVALLSAHAAPPQPAAVPITIEEQPISRTVSAGGNVTLSVVATSTAPLSYQWFKGTQPLTNDWRITGATAAALNLEPAQLTDTSNYFVVASASGTSVTSAVATVLVESLRFAVTPVGTNVIVNVLGTVGEVYRIESAPDFFSAFVTNGYATNRLGVAEYREPQPAQQRFYRARFERLLPVLSTVRFTNGTPLVRAYGKLNETWRFEATDDLAAWSHLGTVTNTRGWMSLSDTNPTGAMRYYRITPP